MRPFRLSLVPLTSAQISVAGGKTPADDFNHGGIAVSPQAAVAAGERWWDGGPGRRRMFGVR